MKIQNDLARACLSVILYSCRGHMRRSTLAGTLLWSPRVVREGANFPLYMATLAARRPMAAGGASDSSAPQERDLELPCEQRKLTCH